MDALSQFDLETTLKQVHSASATLARTSRQDRIRGLNALVKLLSKHQDDILEANTLDLEISRELAIPSIILNWLKLTPERLQNAILTLRQLVHLPDPLTVSAASIAAINRAQSYTQPVPLGTLCLIYEALPELAIILAGMCLKTGNCLLLRGSTEADHSNRIVADLLHRALTKADLPLGCVQPLPCDRSLAIKDLLKQTHYINLVLPYGRPSFVQNVVQQSCVPALPTAMGNCYLLLADLSNSELARSVILESHRGSPDAVNAIEKVLLLPSIQRSRLTHLWGNLKEHGFEVRGNAELVTDFPELTLASQEEWRQPYLQKIVAFKIVDSLDAGIAWINDHSSGHAECLVTESYQESQVFALGVKSATTYINTSPRFSRQFSGPHGTVALGMCRPDSPKPGAIALETLLTSRQVIQGR